jgi:hypothetical protein
MPQLLTVTGYPLLDGAAAGVDGVLLPQADSTLTAAARAADKASAGHALRGPGWRVLAL